MRVTLILLGLFVAVAGYTALVPDSGRAETQFKTEWDKKYLGDKNKDTALYKAWEGKSTCGVCHTNTTRGETKHNNYGEALKKYLKSEDANPLKFKEKKANPAGAVKAQKKILDAFEKAGKEHSDPSDKKSPTFGELIKSGKLEKSTVATD